MISHDFHDRDILGCRSGRENYLRRKETERKPYQYRISLRYLERTQQNPNGLVVSSVEQSEPLVEGSGKGSDPRNR